MKSETAAQSGMEDLEPHSFHDRTGRTWIVSVNVETIKQVRDILGVNLLDIVGDKLIERFYSDPILLCDVIYVLCKTQADELGVSDEDFGRAMAGDAIEAATTALLEELVAFSPSPKDRKNLGKVLQTTGKLLDRARDVVEQRLDSGVMEKEFERLINEQLPEIASDLSGSVPVSSESTPAL